MEKDTLMSPAVVAWIKKAERRMRRDVNWHVTKPEEHKAHVQTVFGTMSLKPGSKEFGVRGVEELEKKLEEGRRKRQEHDVINVSNMKLREAMKVSEGRLQHDSVLGLVSGEGPTSSFTEATKVKESKLRKHP
jgi:hypothetical protein